jgi:hypothetical protein
MPISPDTIIPTSGMSFDTACFLLSGGGIRPPRFGIP